MRSCATSIEGRLAKDLPVFQVISGPRQVGKTTAARQLAERLPFDHIYASADGAMTLRSEWIETQWALAEHKQQTSQKPVLLILDEVQKVDGWSEAIKACWDQLLAKRSPRG